MPVVWIGAPEAHGSKVTFGDVLRVRLRPLRVRAG